MNHQLRLLLQADHGTWVCEITGWRGTRLTKEHIARMRDLLDDGFAVISARAGRKKGRPPAQSDHQSPPALRVTQRQFACGELSLRPPVCPPESTESA